MSEAESEGSAVTAPAPAEESVRSRPSPQASPRKPSPPPREVKPLSPQVSPRNEQPPDLNQVEVIVVKEAVPDPVPVPDERKLVKREVVRVEAAWLKRKKGNPMNNPRGYQVTCTLSGGGPDPAAGKKGVVPKPPAIVKDLKKPPLQSIAVDVKELPEAYMFIADVPGMKNTDIKIDVVNDRFMTISCGRSRPEEKEASYITLERSFGSFKRKFQLPDNANLDAMKAACVEGILTVLVPIAPPPPERVPKPFDVPWQK